jgi:hypothetical protein
MFGTHEAAVAINNSPENIASLVTDVQGWNNEASDTKRLHIKSLPGALYLYHWRRITLNGQGRKSVKRPNTGVQCLSAVFS